MSEVGRVGFVGLGQIGAPMAERLLAWPGGLTVFDVRPEATATCVERGARLAASPSDLAAECDVISVMVRDDTQVRDVLTGAQGILGTARAGTVVAVHSTIAVNTAIELEASCAEHGVALVDAPVSGGFIGAAQGTLAVLVGGADDAVARCEGPFGCFAGLVTHFGPIGSGTRAKLARNLLHFIAFSAAGEAQRLAEAAGLSLSRLARVVRHTDAITGGPGAVMVRPTTGPMAPDDPLYGIMVHTRELGEKDLALALALADELGIDLPLGRLAERELAAALGVPHTSAEEQSMSDEPTPTPPGRRARGIAKMAEVYGWEVNEVHGDFLAMTVDHLFGDVWDRPGFTVAERRLLLIGLLVGLGLEDVVQIQLDAALRLGELTPEQCEDLVIFLSHYAGWPRGAKLNQVVMELVARSRAAAAEPSGDDGV